MKRWETNCKKECQTNIKKEQNGYMKLVLERIETEIKNRN